MAKSKRPTSDGPEDAEPSTKPFLMEEPGTPGDASGTTGPEVAERVAVTEGAAGPDEEGSTVEAEEVARDPVTKDEPGDAVIEAAKPEQKAEPAQVVREIRVERRGGILGVVAGGAIAAAAGYVVASYFPLSAPAANDNRILALETALTSAQDRLASVEGAVTLADELGTRVAALEAQEPPVAPAVDLTPLQSALASLEDRMAAIEAMPVDGGAASNVAVTAALEALRADVDALKGQGEAATARIQDMAAAAEARLAEAEAQAAQLKAEAEAEAERARLTSALGRVQAAMETGAPFATALQDLAGVEIPQVLTDLAETGVPSVASLAAAFPPVAREALDVSRRATMGDSYLERATSFLETATGSRSLAPREGDDPDAVLSRAEAAVGAGDLTTALAELQGLPAEGQAVVAPWVATAQTRLDALAAMTALAAAISG